MLNSSLCYSLELSRIRENQYKKIMVLCVRCVLVGNLCVKCFEPALKFWSSPTHLKWVIKKFSFFAFLLFEQIGDAAKLSLSNKLDVGTRTSILQSLKLKKIHWLFCSTSRTCLTDSSLLSVLLDKVWGSTLFARLPKNRSWSNPF